MSVAEFMLELSRQQVQIWAEGDELCVRAPKGTLTPDQRREIVKGIHDVINSVEKRPPDAQTYVLISEVPSGDWGNAGTVYVPT